MTPPPDALSAYLALYRAGEYWESHEVLEGPWRETGDDFTQGLILLASAWVHWQRGNAHGVRAQLAKTLDRLAGSPDRHLGFDVAAIRGCCQEVRRVVEEHPDDWPERVRPLALVPPVAPE
jgi:predicted metal-dependent hydrolase